MTGLEIVILILGIAFVVISFFMVDNRHTLDDRENKGISGEELSDLKEDIKHDISGEAGKILEEAQDKLESLSNDKIMAVGEYSDQIIEKIKEDHREAVFLYQMLCDKEEELKEMAGRMTNLKTDCERVIREKEQEEKEAKESKKETKVIPFVNSQEPQVVPQVAAKAEQNEIDEPDAQSDEDKVAGFYAEPVKKKPVAKKTTSSSSTKTVRKGGWESVKATDTRDTRMLSRNDEIIALYKENKSVMEISRLLKMGQGEVKLIIDLYCR